MKKHDFETDLGYDVEYAEDIDLLLADSARILLASTEIAKAYGLSKLIKGSYERVELLILIADALEQAGRSKSAASVLAEAATSSNTGLENWQQAELLCRIAEQTFKWSQISEARPYLERAIEVAKVGEQGSSSQEQVDSSSVLAEIAEIYYRFGDKERALQIAHEIGNEGKRLSSLARLANK